MTFDIFVKSLVFFQTVIFGQVKIDVNYIGVRNVFLNIGFERFQQF